MIGKRRIKLHGRKMRFLRPGFSTLCKAVLLLSSRGFSTDSSQNEERSIWNEYGKSCDRL